MITGELIPDILIISGIATSGGCGVYAALDYLYHRKKELERKAEIELGRIMKYERKRI